MCIRDRDNINVGEDAVINITLPNEISNELVSVTIDGKSYTVLINNGKGCLLYTSFNFCVNIRCSISIS